MRDRPPLTRRPSLTQLSQPADHSSRDSVSGPHGSCALRVGEEQEGDVPSCYGDGEPSGGLLVVDGDFYWDGYNYFEGVILVRGENIA